MKRPIYIWLIVMFVFCLPAIALIQRMSLDWMVENADVIALVEVSSVQPKPEGTFINGDTRDPRANALGGYSEFEEYRHCLKSVVVAKVITKLKGTVSEDKMEIEFGFNGSVYPLSNPRYEQAFQYIVFVKKLRDGKYVTLYGYQGQIPVKDAIIKFWHYAPITRMADGTYGTDPVLSLQQGVKAIQDVVKSKDRSSEQSSSSERGGPRVAEPHR